MIKGMVIKEVKTNKYVVISKLMTIEESYKLGNIYLSTPGYEVYFGSSVKELKNNYIVGTVTPC